MEMFSELLGDLSRHLRGKKEEINLSECEPSLLELFGTLIVSFINIETVPPLAVTSLAR